MAKWSKTAEQLAAKEQVIVLAVFAQINVAACKLPSLIKHCSVELSDPVEENPVYWIIHSHPSQMHFSGRRFSLTHRSYYFQPNYGIINILYYVSVQHPVFSLQPHKWFQWLDSAIHSSGSRSVKDCVLAQQWKKMLLLTQCRTKKRMSGTMHAFHPPACIST